MSDPVLAINEEAPRPGIGSWFIGTMPEEFTYLWALVSGLVHRLHHEGSHEDSADVEHRAYVLQATFDQYRDRIEVAALNFIIYTQDLANGDGEFAAFERKFILALLRLTTLIAMRREIEEDLDDLIAELEANFGVNPWQEED